MFQFTSGSDHPSPSESRHPTRSSVDSPGASQDVEGVSSAETGTEKSKISTRRSVTLLDFMVILMDED